MTEKGNNIPNQSDDSPPTNAELVLRSEFIDQLYGTAMDPSSMNQLIEAWEKLITPQWNRPPDRRGAFLDRIGISRHIHQVEDLLARTLGTAVLRPEDIALLPYRRTVAFTLDRTMRVTAANRGARDRLNISRGATLSMLNVRGEDILELTNHAMGMFRSDRSQEPILIRARRNDTDKGLLISLHPCGADGRPDAQSEFILVATTEMHWPADAVGRMRNLLGLSQAEVEVMTSLAQDQSLADIARLRNRSVETVRTQVKSLMAKTETNSQTDLMRLALTAMSLTDGEIRTDTATGRPQQIARGGLELTAIAFQSLLRPDDRHLDYLEFGDPKGRPVIYFCSNFGLCRWPADAEFAARQTGLRVIVPIRAGYGWSDPLGRGTDRIQECAKDTLALMDMLGVAAAHCLVLDEDMIFVARMFKLAPERVLGVLGCSAALPFIRDEQYARMGRWHRFALGTARFTPQFLTFVARAGFALARLKGKADFVRMVYTASPADLAMTRQPRIFDAIDCGADIVLADGVDVTQAYSDETRLFHNVNWVEDFRHMIRSIPVIDLVGTQDQSISPQTLEEFGEDFPEVEIESVENAGSFLLFQHTFHVLQKLEGLMSIKKE